MTGFSGGDDIEAGIRISQMEWEGQSGQRKSEIKAWQQERLAFE